MQATVLFRGVATIAEKNFERLQRYFSRRIHSEARDQLIMRAQVAAGLNRPGLPRNTESLLPETEEPAGLRLGRHDQARDELARSLKGIRGLRAHTECRVGTSNLFTDIMVFGGLGEACRANPLDVDIHVHHFDGACDARTPTAAMGYREADKERKYGPTCRSLGRAFLPLGFSAWGAVSEGTKDLLAMVACAADSRGYVGEVWGTLQGDKIRAMHGLCRAATLSTRVSHCSSSKPKRRLSATL